MTAREDWDATFIPGTDVLANKLGITDADALAAAEYTITAHREAMIVDGRTRSPAPTTPSICTPSTPRCSPRSTSGPAFHALIH